MSTPLNYDVLLYILSVSPPRTATSMMATCSFLYHEEARIILQGPTVLLEPEELSLALLRFVMAEDLSRCSYVREHHVSQLSASVAQMLADLLPRMTGLTVLGLWGDVEPLFKSYPYLPPIFAALRSLKTLLINIVGERCREMMNTLQSALNFTVIYFPLTGPSVLSLAAAFHPVLMLQRSAFSLTELSYNCLFDTNEELTFSPTVIYPKLHSLQLRDRFSLHPLPFIRAFPNLE